MLTNRFRFATPVPSLRPEVVDYDAGSGVPDWQSVEMGDSITRRDYPVSASNISTSALDSARENNVDATCLTTMNDNEKDNTNDNDVHNLDDNRNGGHKLLGFRAIPVNHHGLFDNLSGQETTCHISAQLAGMLFVTESLSDSPAPRDSEVAGLTCYRRNMLKVTAVVHIPRDASIRLDADRALVPVISLSAHLKPHETRHSSPVKLIVVPLKGGTSTQGDPNTEIEPQPIKLDLAANPDRHSDPCPFQISWDRLQFRNATIKSGRRTASQQYFKLTLEIRALANGQEAILSTSVSVPITVRGRSPKNYAQQAITRKLGDVGRLETSASCAFPEPLFPAEGKTFPNTTKRPSFSSFEMESASNTGYVGHYDDMFAEILADTFTPSFHGADEDGAGEQDTFAVSFPVLRDENDSRVSVPPRMETEDESLDDGSPQISVDGVQGIDTLQESIATNQESFQEETGATKQFDIEHSYEYFPLSASDWTTPAEAVYRPHSVHHKQRKNIQESDMQRKRYFRES